MFAARSVVTLTEVAQVLVFALNLLRPHRVTSDIIT